jgi:GNAT superfamily N-acetyltransferase
VSPSPESPRVVGPEQVETVVDILVDAFYGDPLWSWALPDPERRRDQHRVLWRATVEGAIRYPWVWVTDGASATSVWIPPGGSEFSDEQSADFGPAMREQLGSDAVRVLETFDALEHAHPHDVPHFYLSLLGTDPRQRGQGHGLGLLAHNLARIDEIGAPAYLESSNPANVPLYERHGFTVLSWFAPPGGGPEVAGMWREPVTPDEAPASPTE